MRESGLGWESMKHLWKTNRSAGYDMDTFNN